jgi:hypothetical protein
MQDFACLKDLTQLIYQGTERFVLLSGVSVDRWTVHLALSGENSGGKWWSGFLSKDDVGKLIVCPKTWPSIRVGTKQIQGSAASAVLLQAFATNLQNSIIEVCAHLGVRRAV